MESLSFFFFNIFVNEWITMVAEKSLLFPFLPSTALISRLNKSFNGILRSGLFDVVPTASNAGGIQTAGSWKGSNSTIVGVQSGGGAAWQCLVVPKMHTHRVVLLSCSPALLEHLSRWWGLLERPAGWWQGVVSIGSTKGQAVCLLEGSCWQEWQRHVCPGSAEMSVYVTQWPLLTVLH